MLKRIAKAISVSRAWVLSIAFLAAIGVTVESSQPFQACVKETYYNPGTENFEKSITSFSTAFDVSRDCFGNFTHDNAEAIIAAFTIILALSTIFLWVATRDLVRGAENTAKQQLRAYLSIDAARRHGAHTLTPQFNIRFKNCGQTPAYNGTYWIDIKVCEFPLSSNLIPSGKKTIGIFEMPPTNTFVAGQMNDDNIASLSGEQADGFDCGKIAFYIFGQCDFYDAFDEPRRLKFRLRYGTECVPHGALAIEEINSN